MNYFKSLFYKPNPICQNNIEEYICSLPKTITELNLSNKKLTHIPDLTKFIHLKILNVSNNQLTELPMLPEKLTELYCYNNLLTELPTLPDNLEILICCLNNIKNSNNPNPSNKILEISGTTNRFVLFSGHNLTFLNCSYYKIPFYHIFSCFFRYIFTRKFLYKNN